MYGVEQTILVTHILHSTSYEFGWRGHPQAACGGGGKNDARIRKVRIESVQALLLPDNMVMCCNAYSIACSE